MAAFDMRLRQMSIAGFRGFSTERLFDLDADVVLVSGANGTGKTSFFDALLWGLAGSVERVGPSDSLVSRFSEFGECRVDLELVDDDGEVLRLVRRFSDAESLSVDYGGRKCQGTSAQTELMSMIWPDGQGSASPLESFARSLTRSAYLEQDRVNAFVDADDEQQRFEIVAEIVGAGRLGELNRQLETGRGAWTRATRRLDEDFEPTLRQHDQLGARLQELASYESAVDLESALQIWVNEVRSLVDLSVSESTSSEQTIEMVLEAIARSVRSSESEFARWQRLQDHLAAEPAHAGDLSQVEMLVASLEQQHDDASARLREAELSAAEERRDALAEGEVRRSLGTMAQLALRHIGPSCPVCGQAHERSATEERLNDLVSVADLPVHSAAGEGVETIADEVRQIDAQLASARAELREIETAKRRFESWLDGFRAEAAELSLHDVTPRPELRPEADRQAEVLRDRIRRLQEYRSAGEQMSALFARSTEVAQAVSLRQQLESLEERVREHRSTIGLRDRAAADAHRLHDAIRAVSESLVAEELTRIEPLLQRIYATVDTHPAFRAVKFLTRMHRGRGRLWTAVEATSSQDTITIDEPRTVLSSSQLNVLAVATFLALNLSIADPPLKVVALDDPLQSLDNVNLLGLSDLLRRFRGRRQIILSTHDVRLASLLERKLRPVGPSERTISISLTAWDTSGPRVRTREVPRDSGQLKLVSVS